MAGVGDILLGFTSCGRRFGIKYRLHLPQYRDNRWSGNYPHNTLRKSEANPTGRNIPQKPVDNTDHRIPTFSQEFRTW
jgi:hypothetical protein